MAKKKTQTLSGISRDPESKLIVQKSRPLFALWRSDLSLAEFKILDMYLARIDTRKPEQRTIQLTKGQLEAALGVSRINRTDLKQRLRSLYQPIDLANGDKKRIHLVGLFEEAEAEQDENGIWQISLTCTTSAMKYIFKAEELGYLRYKLRSITSLTSRYTYVLFTYLEDNRFRKSWEVPLAELKEILNCENEETYRAYKRFNDLILKKCQRELHEKTECRFTYEPIRTGRSVTAIRFTLETLADSIEPPAPAQALPGQLSLDDYEDPNQLIAEALPDSLTSEQIEALRILAGPKVFWNPGSSLPRECAIADYLRHKVLLMNAHNRDVKHPFNYLKTMIEQDEDAFY